MQLYRKQFILDFWNVKTSCLIFPGYTLAIHKSAQFKFNTINMATPIKHHKANKVIRGDLAFTILA